MNLALKHIVYAVILSYETDCKCAAVILTPETQCVAQLGTSGLIREIGASGLSDDDDGKNDGLKWNSRNQTASGITFFPVVHYRLFVAEDEAVLKY